VTVSFDPVGDTPQRMGELRSALAPQADWRFLTARDAAQLGPVLEDYGQDALRLLDPHGSPTALIRHVLKVFLVDSRRGVRNIYSAEFLRADLLLADVQTLLLEAARD
jgi:cytochrome c peroxidase